MITVPGGAGSGLVRVVSTCPDSEGALSTRATPIAGRPSRSMIVFGIEACECHCASMP